MRILELQKEIDLLGAPFDSYLLAGGLPSERLCISQEPLYWSVRYSEQGLRTEEERYASEHEACVAFIERLSRMLGKNTKRQE